MMGPEGNVRIYVAAGVTDMRKGFDGLTLMVQEHLRQNPLSGSLYVFRGRRGDRIKLLWYDRDGCNLYYKRLESGRFVWPRAQKGAVRLSRAQLSMLLEGIDWRRPRWTSPPDRAG